MIAWRRVVKVSPCIREIMPMGEPITPHATIPHPADIDAALRELDVSEPMILPVAEAACESPRLDTLQSLAGDSPDE